MSQKELVALVLVIVLVVGLNLTLILKARRGSSFRLFSREVKMFQDVARQARNPWQQEDEDLEELARLVEGLKREEPLPGEDSS